MRCSQMSGLLPSRARISAAPCGTQALPLPPIGSAIGAVAGAAIGAFGGAWLGEAWKGSELTQRTTIGKAAMTGRMAGMQARLAVGTAMFVVPLVNLW